MLPLIVTKVCGPCTVPALGRKRVVSHVEMYSFDSIKRVRLAGWQALFDDSTNVPLAAFIF